MAITENISAQDRLPFEKTEVFITVDSSGIVVHNTAATPVKAKKPSGKLFSSNQVLSTQAISINIQTINATCRSLNGSINAIAGGGVPPYKYKFNGYGPFDNGYFPRIQPGNHIVEVTDAAGATASATAVVGNTNEPPELTVTSFNHPTSCERADGNFVVAASGGLPPYEYTLDNVNFTTSPSFNGFPAGFYIVKVRDAKGCIGSARVTLLSPSWCGIPFGLIYSSLFCESEGHLKITYYGFNPPYENSLNGAPFTSATEYFNLSPGQYVIDIKSSTGELTKFMFHIEKSCYPRTNVQVTENTCGLSDGRIILTTDNGTPPYQYSIDGVNFQTSNEFNGLTAGRYNIGVVDAKGQIMRIEADVNGGCFTVTENHKDVVCSNHNGSIEITATGGKPPYTYSIDGSNFQSSNIFEGLEAGTYNITVSDANQQKKSITVEIKNSPPFKFLIPKAAPACYGDQVKLTIWIDGGTPPYRYSINTIDFQDSPEFDILAGQPYNILVKDAVGCQVGMLYSAPVACFQVSVDVFNATCGQNNGNLQIHSSDGTAPYQYSIDGINYQSSNVFNNLSPGAYEVTVKDAGDITRKVNVEIESSCPQMQLDVQNATCGNQNGQINVVATNGQEPYLYSLNGAAYSNQPSFKNLGDGTYTVSLKDATGYIIQQQALISNTTIPQMDVTAADASCASGGTINISATGGTGTLLYSIDGSNFSADPVFKQLKPDVYQVQTIDNLGCKSSTQAEIKLLNDLSFNLTTDLSICEGAETKLEITDPKAGYKYAWRSDNGAINANNSSLTVAPKQTTAYTLIVTEGLCDATNSVVVTVLPAPVANAGDDLTICFGQSTQLNGTGGNAYSWQPSSFLSDATSGNPEVTKPDATQEYFLTVKDLNGCTSLQPSSVLVKVTPPAKLFVGNDTIVAKNEPFRLNATDVNNSGFTQYQWTPVTGLDDPHAKSPVITLQSGVMYSVTATTEAGCESRDQIKIEVFDHPDIYVPNAFTPNNDGLNDNFKVIAVGIKTFKYFEVFNRWGQRVFSSGDPSRGWNGQVGSKQAENGTYVWRVEGIDFNGKVISRRGTVTLIR